MRISIKEILIIIIKGKIIRKKITGKKKISEKIRLILIEKNPLFLMKGIIMLTGEGI